MYDIVAVGWRDYGWKGVKLKVGKTCLIMLRDPVNDHEIDCDCLNKKSADHHLTPPMIRIDKS